MPILSELSLPENAPMWMTLTAFILGLLNFVVVLAPLWIFVRRRAKLRVRLLEELKLRVGTQGETIHVFISMSPQDGGVTILSVAVTARKVDDSQKTYKFKVHSSGTKEFLAFGHVEYFYDSNSVYQNIGEFQTVNRVWFCLADTKYKSEFENVVKQITVEVDNRRKQSGDVTSDEFTTWRSDLISRHFENLRRCCQFEPGDWRLEVEVNYRPQTGPWRRKVDLIARSELRFEIGKTFLDEREAQMKRYFEDLVSQSLGVPQIVPANPEYEPQSLHCSD